MVGKTVRALLSLSLAAAGHLALALPDDRHQAIEIESRSAIRDEKKGLTVYEGDVSIRQGSILIRADKVSLITTAGKVTRIVCTGKPAQYQQTPKAGDKPVVAKANTIEYQLDRDTIQLISNASLEQDGATLTGERIDYDLKQEVIKARGDAAGDKRIRMVIPPSQQESVQ
ncbi:MAG: lipopolysaccharide transport periplasmic protein LptA [Porticoccaceae bacterium]|nr:lipopolysaccharide transport periplasmic protein LptA [Porticoccaceae bacterium]